MVLNIITYPNKNLRQKSQLLTLEQIQDQVWQQFFIDLAETMQKKDGIGLAAIQVDRAWRVFVVSTEDGPKFFINPKIIRKSWKKVIDEEGCLSIPDVYGLVRRPEKIVIKARDIKGQKFQLKASGMYARVIQHEYDHLHGKLFIDKIEKITKGKINLEANW